MIVAHDGIGAMLSGGVFLIVLVAAEAWARIGRPHPEWTRKLVHVAGGLICLGFPFVLRSPWIVLALSATLSGVFALGAYTGGLRSLHGVTRRSRGAEYYPLAVTLVFLMALGRPWLYVASIMTLAVADAAAALVGSAYGRIRYEVDGSSKSVEGSLAFFMMAFWVIHIPLLLMTDLPRETCLLAAALVALLVTGFEAVSLGGADNLFVPIGVCAILARITTKPVPEIAFQLSSLLALLVVGSALIRRTRAFNTGATLTFVLFAYGAWSLGSPHWAVPILSGLALYILVRLLWITPDTVQVRVRILFRALVVPLILLVLANATQSSGQARGVLSRPDKAVALRPVRRSGRRRRRDFADLGAGPNGGVAFDPGALVVGRCRRSDTPAVSEDAGCDRTGAAVDRRRSGGHLRSGSGDLSAAKAARHRGLAAGQLQLSGRFRLKRGREHEC